jgi:hypothetical protein
MNMTKMAYRMKKKTVESEKLDMKKIDVFV